MTKSIGNKWNGRFSISEKALVCRMQANRNGPRKWAETAIAAPPICTLFRRPGPPQQGSVLGLVDQLVLADPRHHCAQLRTGLFDR
ncbi:MAG: hypothetical protein WA842_11190, partial [Croceibacterium sp.]